MRTDNQRKAEQDRQILLQTNINIYLKVRRWRCSPTLTDPGRSCRYHSLRSWDIHDFEEEPRTMPWSVLKIGYRKTVQIFNDPLHHAKIIHHLNECDEEDDRCQLGGTKIRWLDTEKGKWNTVLTKNQCLLMVSASKKKTAPASAWFKKSLARVAIHLNIENPAPVFKTNNATTCCKKSPTMTVGLMERQVIEGSWVKSEKILPRNRFPICRREPES